MLRQSCCSCVYYTRTKCRRRTQRHTSIHIHPFSSGFRLYIRHLQRAQASNAQKQLPNMRINRSEVPPQAWCTKRLERTRDASTKHSPTMACKDAPQAAAPDRHRFGGGTLSSAAQRNSKDSGSTPHHFRGTRVVIPHNKRSGAGGGT